MRHLTASAGCLLFLPLYILVWLNSSPYLYQIHTHDPSLHTGMLPESHWNSSWLCCCVEQSGLCLQCSRRDLVGHTSLWKGCCSGSQLLGCIHQSGECTERSAHIWPVSVLLFVNPRLDRKIQHGLSCSSFGLSQCKMEDAFQKGVPWVVSCNLLVPL